MALLKKKISLIHVAKANEDIEIDIDIQSPITDDFEININIDFDASIAGIDFE